MCLLIGNHDPEAFKAMMPIIQGKGKALRLSKDSYLFVGSLKKISGNVAFAVRTGARKVLQDVSGGCRT